MDAIRSRFEIPKQKQKRPQKQNNENIRQTAAKKIYMYKMIKKKKMYVHVYLKYARIVYNAESGGGSL